MFEEKLINKEQNIMLEEQEKKRKTDYGVIILVFCFCFFLAFLFMKLVTTQPLTSSSISLIDDYSISSDKLTDRREVYRVNAPSTYCIKIDSFKKFGDSPNTVKYESRTFESGGYNWTLVIYPKGNTMDGAILGWTSLYIQIDNSTLLNSPKEVYAEVKFYIYNRIQEKYYTYQETDPKRFFLFKPYWGYGNVRTYNELVAPAYGWVFDDDSVLFGVDVFVIETFNKWEVLTFSKSDFHNRLHKWTLQNFSSLDKLFYVSETFEIGGRSWALKVYPNGDGEAQGNSLSLYVVAVYVKPYEEIYLKAKLRILNKKDSKHVEKQVETWSNQAKSWGFQKFVSLADLKDTSRGLIVNDALEIEIEFENFSKTKVLSELGLSCKRKTNMIELNGY